MMKTRQTPKEAKRAIVYYRTSTDRQVMDAQVRDVEGVCQQNGWEIVGTYEDPDVSTRKAKRPGKDAAFEALGQGAADYLVVQWMDRIARTAEELTQLPRVMESQGWELVENGRIIDAKTAHGKFVFTIMAARAEFERDRLRERIVSALDAKREKGIIGGRKPIDPILEEQIVAKRKEGWTLEQIANALNEDGIPTPQGGTVWRKSSLHGLMKRNGLDGTIKKLGKPKRTRKPKT